MSDRRAEFGALVRERRFLNSLSQKGLAERLGVSQAAVCRWEAGERVPNNETLFALAKVLKVPLRRFWDLLYGEPAA